MADAIERRVPARAFTEFVVIVAGVLVALAANSWYSQRQDRKLERYYLEQLYADLQGDTAQFAFIERLLRVKHEALALMDESFVREGRSFADSTLVRAMIQAEALSTSLPAIRDATFSELNSTGRLGLIRNPALRSEVVRYYSRVQEERIREEGRRTDYTAASYVLIPHAARSRVDEYGMITAISQGQTSFPIYRSGTPEDEHGAQLAAAAAVSAARSSGFGQQVNAERAHALYLQSMLIRLEPVVAGYLMLLQAELQGEPTLTPG